VEAVRSLPREPASAGLLDPGFNRLR